MKIIDKRNVKSDRRLGQQARSAPAETDNGEYRTVSQAIKKLRDEFPVLAFQDARRILYDCGLDVQRASAAIRKERQSVIMLEEEFGEKVHDPSKPSTSSVRRGGNDLGNQGRVNTVEAPVSATAPVGRGGDGNEVISDSEKNSSSAGAIRTSPRNPFQDEIKAKSNDPLITPTMAQAPRSRIPLIQKAPDLSTAHCDIVEIIVGKDNPQSFMVHRSFLCHASPYFRAAFNQQSLFIESKTQQMTIDITAPKIFGLFQKWVYAGKHMVRITDDNDKLPPVMDLIELWIFGAKVQTPVLQNLALLGFWKFWGPDFATVPSSFRWLYNNTSPQSPLRKLLIDLVICKRMSQQTLSRLLENHWDQIPEDMKKDMVLALKTIERAANSKIQLPPLNLKDYLVPEK